MTTVLKLALLIVFVPIAGLIVALLVYIASEVASPDESYASSVGMSVRECIAMSTRLGMHPNEADAMCTKRIPKKGPRSP